MNHRAFIQSVITVLIGLSSLASAQEPPSWFDEVDSYLGTQLAQTNLPGTAVAVVSPNDVLYLRGFGETAIGSGQAITPETPFEIGSLTKSMTALAVLQLQERGLVDLDAPVQAYLPWFRVADESASADITVRQLLSHTSGLPTNSHSVVWQDFARIDPSIEEGVRALATVNLARSPGESFQYANMGYVTLGALIEAVSGAAWSDYLRANIFEPLGMSASAASIQARSELSVAQPYTWRLTQRVPVPPMSAFAAPAGSLNVSSAADMATYLQAWLAPSAASVVRPGAAREAFEPTAPIGNREQIGLGWIRGERHGDPLFHHTGGTVGAASYMALLPDRGIGVIVLANSMKAPAPNLGRGILDIILDKSPASVGVDGGRLSSYILTGAGAVSILLIARLASRIVGVVRRGWPIHRVWVHLLRTAVLLAAAGVLWYLIPVGLSLAGLPAPFGVRGYPLDIAFAMVTLLAASSGWAAYALASLSLSLQSKGSTAERIAT